MNSVSRSKDYALFSNTQRALKKKKDLTLGHKENFTDVSTDT